MTNKTKLSGCVCSGMLFAAVHESDTRLPIWNVQIESVGIWPYASESWARRLLARAFARPSARFFRHLSHLQPRRVMTLVR